MDKRALSHTNFNNNQINNIFIAISPVYTFHPDGYFVYKYEVNCEF